MMPSQQRISTTVKTGAKGVPTKSTTITNLPPKEMKGKEFVSDPKNDIYYDKERGLAFVKQPTTTYSFDAIKQKFGKEWVEMKEGTDNINESVKAFENAGGDTQKEIIDGIKNAIVKYNEEVGEGGKKIDIDPEKIAVPLPNQKDQFGNQKYALSKNVSPYEYAALLNLASQKTFKKGGWIEDKDLTASMQKNEEEKNKFLLKAMEGEQARAKIKLESALTEGREIDKEKRMGNALLLAANGIDKVAKEHGQVVTATGGLKKINLALTQPQLAAFATAGKTTSTIKEAEGSETETTSQSEAKKVPDLVQKNPDGTYTVMHYRKKDQDGKKITEFDKNGNPKIDEELTHTISNESYLQGLASTLYDKKDMPTGFAAALEEMNKPKKPTKETHTYSATGNNGKKIYSNDGVSWVDENGKPLN